MAILQVNGSSGPSVTVNWGNLPGKPTTFPPAAHTHPWSAVTGKPSTFPAAVHSHVVAWAQVTSKPATFPPAAHAHPEVTSIAAGQAILFDILGGGLAARVASLEARIDGELLALRARVASLETAVASLQAGAIFLPPPPPPPTLG